jgi:hypothetical protein
VPPEPVTGVKEVTAKFCVTKAWLTAWVAVREEVTLKALLVAEIVVDVVAFSVSFASRVFPVPAVLTLSPE